MNFFKILELLEKETYFSIVDGKKQTFCNLIYLFTLM